MDANGRGALSRGGIVFHSLCLAKTAQQTSVIYQFLFLVCLEQLKSKQFIVCRLKVITIIWSKTLCTNLISISALTQTQMCTNTVMSYETNRR